MSNRAAAAIQFDGVSKRYRKNLPLLDSVSFSISYGEVVGLFGPSGSGKSTILQMACGLVSPDSGQIIIDGKCVFPHSKNGVDASSLRNSTISYLPQDDFLFESLSVADNVLFAIELKKTGPLKKNDKLKKVEQTLASLGISDLANRQISDISAGERKRVAIGRSLVTNPRIIIADEPTSSLDLETTNDLLKLVRDMAQQQQIAFFVASHDVLEVKNIADRVYGIKGHTLFKVGGKS